MKKKFKHPLLISGTPVQLQLLIPELVALGYDTSNDIAMRPYDLMDDDFYTQITTNFNGSSFGVIGFVDWPAGDSGHTIMTLPENRKTIIALAAITEDFDPETGLLSDATQSELSEKTLVVSEKSIRRLYSYTPARSALKEKFEEAFPFLRPIPRPTFRVGERILQFGMTSTGDSVRELLIVGPKSMLTGGYVTILLIDETGIVHQETTPVTDPQNITEEELLQAGRPFSLTVNNYAKFCQE